MQWELNTTRHATPVKANSEPSFSQPSTPGLSDMAALVVILWAAGQAPSGLRAATHCQSSWCTAINSEPRWLGPVRHSLYTPDVKHGCLLNVSSWHAPDYMQASGPSTMTAVHNATFARQLLTSTVRPSFLPSRVTISASWFTLNCSVN